MHRAMAGIEGKTCILARRLLHQLQLFARRQSEMGEPVDIKRCHAGRAQTGSEPGETGFERPIQGLRAIEAGDRVLAGSRALLARRNNAIHLLQPTSIRLAVHAWL